MRTTSEHLAGDHPEPWAHDECPDGWSPSQYGAIVGELSPDVLILVDPTGVVRHDGSSVERVLGFSRGEHVGSFIWDFVHPEDLTAAAGALNETARGAGYHHPTEFRVRDHRGQWVRCEVAGTSVDGPGGRWLVLSLRPSRDRGQVIARRRRIETLIRVASLECSAAQWRTADELVRGFLAQLAEIVGAEMVELAWEEGEQGLRLGACWSDPWPSPDCGDAQMADFEPLWPVEESSDRLLSFSSDPGSLPPSTTRDALVGRGARAVVEVPLSSRPPWGVLRLSLGERWRQWDDANVDLVVVLVTTLMSTLRRCRAEAHLVKRARTDPLTGLMNRTELYRRFERLLRDRDEGVRRGDSGRIGVLYGDLDHFKQVNDRFGHAAGDRLLLGVADALRAVVRDVDVVARIGGDEFVVVCPDLESDAHLRRVVDRVSRAVESLGAEGGPVRMSVGGVLAAPGVSADEAVRLADEAMYRVKHGRGTYRRP